MPQQHYTSKGRFKLIIKQVIQVELYTDEHGGINDRYNDDNGYSFPQTTMTMFASDDHTVISETARRLRSLQSNTSIIVYDSITGARVNVK